MKHPCPRGRKPNSETCAILLLFALVLPAHGQTFGTSGTSTLQVTVAAEAGISITASTTTLASSGSVFNPYTGTTNFTYKIRTTTSSGSGTIQLQVTSDFGPAGGPSVASSGTSGDTLTYTCSVAASGTPCSGTQTASTTSQKSVATFGSGAHSAQNGDSGSVTWSLKNDPTYPTGSYSATITFTVSSI